MPFTTTFRIGSVYSNEELYTEFQCANMGGMRKSNTTNTLVIISDHTKPLYDDQWNNGILNYTGMGKVGNQDINFMQNRTLNESRTNGVQVHLFEVYTRGAYTYKGEVELAGNPFSETQLDDHGNQRQVWMFPLKIK